MPPYSILRVRVVVPWVMSLWRMVQAFIAWLPSVLRRGRMGSTACLGEVRI